MGDRQRPIPGQCRTSPAVAVCGIVPGAAAHDARLIDLAPTVAALLGLPAPRHAEGRALVELLRLAPGDAARRSATDEARGRAAAAVVDAARGGAARPVAARLAVLAAGLAITIALAWWSRRRGAIALSPAALAGVFGFAVVLLAIAVVTRGEMSPSYVPTLERTEQRGALGVAVALAIQLAASWRAVRRAPDPTAAANGIALVGTALALATVALVRAWFSPPHIEVPPPFWMVAVPAADLAAATCALGNAALLVLAMVRLPRATFAQRDDGARSAPGRVAH